MKTRGTQNSRAQGTPAPGGVGAGEVAIRVRGLRKRYGDVEAVRGIDLTVHKGEIFAFLGPNGAGKTTTVETLEGYRHRDAGEVEVLGSDPARPVPGWRAASAWSCRNPSRSRAHGRRVRLAVRRLLPEAAAGG